MDAADRKYLIIQFIERLHDVKHRFLSEANVSCDLPFSQMAILHLVEQHQDIGIKQMAQLLGITSSAVTQLVNTLVDKGYLSRHDNSSDRRSLQINLTQKCREEVEQLEQRQIERMTGVFEALSDEELENYIKLNKKIIDSLKNTTFR